MKYYPLTILKKQRQCHRDKLRRGVPKMNLYNICNAYLFSNPNRIEIKVREIISNETSKS